MLDCTEQPSRRPHLPRGAGQVGDGATQKGATILFRGAGGCKRKATSGCDYPVEKRKKLLLAVEKVSRAGREQAGYSSRTTLTLTVAVTSRCRRSTTGYSPIVLRGSSSSTLRLSML